MMVNILSNIIEPYRFGFITDLIPETLKFHLRECITKFVAYLNYNDPEMFTNIEIGTTDLCNRRCSYCPSSRFPSKNRLGNMKKEIYTNIINQLADINYKNIIHLHHFGEPLLDKNIEYRVNEARKKLMDAKIYFSSNGDYLFPEKFKRLIKAGITQIVVTNHNPNGEYSKALRSLLDYLKKNPKYKKYFKLFEIKYFSNRGGLIKLGKKKKRMKMRKCQYTHVLEINPRGNVVLCCNDYLEKNVFGNVQKKTLMNIWNNKEFKKIRKNNRKGRYALDICKNCAQSRYSKFTKIP